MLVQVRGTSGSGKSFIAFKLLNKYNFEPVQKKGKIIGYYAEECNLFVVGKYETACGGCDSIKTQDEICSIVVNALKKGYNVFFEGLLCSHLAERYAKLYRIAKKHTDTVTYIFLNTPVEKCASNVNKRRAEKGQPPKECKTLESHYHSTFKSRVNLMGYDVPEEDLPIMSSKEAYRYITKKLKEE